MDPRQEYEVVVDGMSLKVPKLDRCWAVDIYYACRCRASESTFGVRHGKTVKVKKDSHTGSCLLRHCLVGSISHYLPDMCRVCEMEKARSEGAPV